jgi:phospholipid/cholesterol/gamma-HCH transport system substrate-binding protein
MQKQAPSAGRILVAVGFTLSCFALLLFLWVTFGGAVPFKPESYKISADFPEAITLQKEADVRISGVTVGKVKDLELPEDGNATRAIMEIDPEFAPISSDATAILRQKTLLGETYVELATGSQVNPESGEPVEGAEGQTVDVGSISGADAVHPIEEGGQLDSAQVAEQTQIDEIFNGFDEATRRNFQVWMKNSAIGVNGRGLDLNDSMGNIGPFSEDASDVLTTLRRQEEALRGVVRNTGAVFEALTAGDQELAGAIVGSNRTFRALASRDEALADTFQVLPTFENESRLTLDRLQAFAGKAGPLFRDLRPVARDLSPTLRDLRRLSPNARRLFNNLNPLIKASEPGLPALGSVLRELQPVTRSLDPFLANFNPILRYVDYGAPNVNDFLSNPSSATSGTLPPIPGQTGPRHISRQLGIISPETLSVHQQRLRTNRGNGYIQPFGIGNPFSASQEELFPSHDCNNTGATGGLGAGQVTINPPSAPPVQEGEFPLSIFPGADPSAPTTAFAGCTLAPNYPAQFGGGRVPLVDADPPYNTLP